VVTRMCGQREGRLSVAIAGINNCTLSKKIKDGLDATPLDRIFPGSMHQSGPSRRDKSLTHRVCDL
jgi:hypothetical protein